MDCQEFIGIGLVPTTENEYFCEQINKVEVSLSRQRRCARRKVNLFI